MARMKIEVQSAHRHHVGLSLHDRLVGYLPRYAGMASRLAGVMNLRNSVPGLASVLERPTGFAAQRNLPAWRRDPFRDNEVTGGVASQAVLFADTFNRYFEPENLRAAAKVLQGGGIALATVTDGGRPLCCGRTFLSAGLVDEARREAERLVAALLPHSEAERSIVGLEPSCLMTLKDEIPGLLKSDASRLVASHVMMFEDFVSARVEQGQLDLELKPLSRKALVHGHCHQKSYDLMPGVNKVLDLIPELQAENIPSGCCGMAGAFGYGRDTVDISLQMAELDLLPAVREQQDALIVADGTSCRHQIADGAGREALHVVRVLEMALI